MPGFFLAPILLALTPAALLAGLALHLARALRAARAEAGTARRLAEDRGRCLGLLAQEMRGTGLALLGQADGLAGQAALAAAAAGQQMLRLADDISDHLAHLAGPRRLAPEALPLAPLLEEAVAEVAARLGAGQRHWRLAADFAALTLRADRRALLGALTQVLARAARMTRDGDAIELRPVLTEETVAIVVEDEGAGLPAADLAAGAPAGTRGLGFGLAVARSLLEAHGGGLRLEALPGIGGRAWLILPRERLVAPPGGSPQGRTARGQDPALQAEDGVRPVP